MARGSNAKEKVAEAIKQLYGDKFVGIDNKKLYVLEDDDGEQVQIAISMTCPKVPLEVGNKEKQLNSNSKDSDIQTLGGNTAEITKEEEDVINKVFKELGL